MTNVKTILESYERTGSYRRTAREEGVAHNTVKYVGFIRDSTIKLLKIVISE